MSHVTIREWGHVKLGENGLTRGQADALHAAARQHPLAHRDAANILGYGRDQLVARQMVGMIAAQGCSLEILPKVDPDRTADEPVGTVRSQLVRMLDIALGLHLDLGSDAAIERQRHTLLEILIRAFADKLLGEVRRGLPRLYQQCDDDLPALRGRLDVARQFTRHAVRPDRLACRFDQLDADTPLMRIMAAAVVFLGKHARAPETRRMLEDLRHAFAEVPVVAVARLPWEEVRINRTNRRWESLFRLAQLLLRREWQATHHNAQASEGLTLLFPMNDLFEKYVAALMRRALAGSGIEVIAQGGLVHCLGEWAEGQECTGTHFQTKPDIILRRCDSEVAIIDTKWKNLGARDDPKHGVSQSDVYQLMAYARLYGCSDLMLLYPSAPGEEDLGRAEYGIHGGPERLRIAALDLARTVPEIVSSLRKLVLFDSNHGRAFAGDKSLVPAKRIGRQSCERTGRDTGGGAGS